MCCSQQNSYRNTFFHKPIKLTKFKIKTISIIFKSELTIRRRRSSKIKITQPNLLKSHNAQPTKEKLYQNSKRRQKSHINFGKQVQEFLKEKERTRVEEAKFSVWFSSFTGLARVTKMKRRKGKIKTKTN